MSQEVAVYSVVVTIVYISIYSSVFFAVSIFCAYQIGVEMKSQATSTDNTDDNIVEQLKDKTNQKPSLCSRKFMKLWIKSLWRMKKIYISIVPHIFDQATDLGVLFQYYTLWQDDNYTVIRAQYWFFISIFVMIFYKIVSCISVYFLTHSWSDIVYQFFDVLMVRAVYTNYKMQAEEPSNAQRYLQILEATFESSPQVLLSMAFILKTNEWDGIVLVSTIASLWTLTSRVSSDDKDILREDWKRIQFTYKRCPILNTKYMFRVICWRFCEITNKIALYSLTWSSLGGFSLIIIVSFEFICCSVVSFLGENFIIMGNLLYFSVINGSLIREKYPWGGVVLMFAKIYRFAGLYILLSLITVFAMVDFEVWKVPDYQVRHGDVITDSLGFGIFIYCWVTAIIWPLSLYAIARSGGIQVKYSGRDLMKLIKAEQWDAVVELVQFGCDTGDIRVNELYVHEKKMLREMKLIS